MPVGDPLRPRIDVDRKTLKRILAVPIDDGLAAALDESEMPVVDPSVGG